MEQSLLDKVTDERIGCELYPHMRQCECGHVGRAYYRNVVLLAVGSGELAEVWPTTLAMSKVVEASQKWVDNLHFLINRSQLV